MESPLAYDGASSNARPYAIFCTYMGVCLGLTVFIISRLVKNYSLLRQTQSPPRRLVILFAALATSSLLATWGFMLRYFQFSYETWLASRLHYDLDPHCKHWGLWLRETSLFKEAWQSVVVGETRFWWSSQIFFFASGLGLYLEQKGARRQLGHTWAFMLLGQIVAISFATNLFLLTLLVSPGSTRPTSTTKAYGRRWLGPWLIDLLALQTTFASVAILGGDKNWNFPTMFLPALMAPHVALMAMPVARAILPATFFTHDNADFVKTAYDYMCYLVAVVGLGRVQAASYKLFSLAGVGIICSALFEHPAVSSVGFDAIFCWITWLCWWAVRGSATMPVKDQPTRLGDAKRAVRGDQGITDSASE